MRNINFFKNKIKNNNNNLKFNGQIGDVIIGEYLSIDRDGIHQYKFGGVCIAVLKRANSTVQHILLRQKIANAKVDFCINITSPLIYLLKIVGKKELVSKNKSYKEF
jgi:ribosomal protein L19